MIERTPKKASKIRPLESDFLLRTLAKPDKTSEDEPTQ
jgi:hypothetical protein